MSPLLSFFHEAAEEIEQERAWYRERSLSAETAFLRELDHAIEMVTSAPLQWQEYDDVTRRYVFPTFPFSLVYFVEDGAVKVVALAHHSKRPEYWTARLSDSE